ncbi:hypothetical protein CHUAL_009636 [Chamberlinius hualienensis]
MHTTDPSAVKQISTKHHKLYSSQKYLAVNPSDAHSLSYSSHSNSSYVKSTQPCYECGGQHYCHNCKLKDAKCHKCHHKGHIARVCHSRDEKSSAKSANVAAEPLGSPVEYLLHCVTHFPKSNTFSDLQATVTINDVPCVMEVDLG